jgi:predicted transcriptional regulator
MHAPSNLTAGELFIVDNSDELWKGLKYLHDWTEIASAFDIATGFFEIGALLALEPGWQKLDKIRILLGDEMTARTRQALLEGLRERTKAILDSSIEQEKEANDFLAGVPAIVEGIHSGKIECKVYAKKKAEAATDGGSVATEGREVVLTIGLLEKANRAPLRVSRQDTVTKAITLMMQNDTAYLAVMSGDRTVDGILSWRTIGKAGAAKRAANTVEHYLATVRIVEIDTPLFDAVRDIVEAEVVLVRAKDRTICGLVSAQDIATQFVTLSEPFLFLEQIENHLRAILEKARLPSSAVKELVNPADADRIEKVNGIDDLSFGETARAFGREEIWNKLHLLLDRPSFCIRLEEIRSIRNKVMHFHPDGISDEDREILRKTRQMLQAL